MATINTQRQLVAEDFSFFLSPQTTAGAIDLNPVWTPVNRSDGLPINQFSKVKGNNINTTAQGRKYVGDAVTSTAELSFDVTEQTVGFLPAIIHGTAVDNTISSVNTIEATAIGFTGSFGNEFANISVGDVFKVKGFADEEINTFYIVSAKPDDANITTTVSPAATELEGASVTFESIKTESAKDQTMYATQVRARDDSQAGDVYYQTNYDGVVGTASINIEQTGIMTGAMTLNLSKIVQDLNGDPSEQPIQGQTDGAQPEQDGFSNINNVAMIAVDGIDSGCDVNTLSLEVNNGYQDDGGAAGCKEREYLRTELDVTGSLNTKARVSNPFLWKRRYQAESSVRVTFFLTWGVDRWAAIDLPQMVITEHSMPNGTNAVSVNEMSYGLEPSDSFGTQIRVFTN